MTREEPTKAMIDRAAMTGRLRREQCYTIADQLEADGAEIARLSAALHNSEAVRVKLEKAAADRQAAPVAHIHFAGGLLSGAPTDVDAAGTEIERLTAELDAAVTRHLDDAHEHAVDRGELLAENETLRTALHPFAEYAKYLGKELDVFDGEMGERIVGALRRSIRYSDLRRAREALERKP